MKNPSLILLLVFSIHGSSLSAGEFDDLVEKGNSHAVRYEEEAALEYFLAAEKLEPKDADLLAAISKEYRHLMSDAKGKKSKLAYGNTALQYAEKAAAAGPRNSHAQLATAITLGKLLPLIKGNGEKLKASQRIKKSAERALAIDPKNDTAWFVLGRWNQGFAGMSSVKRKIGGMIHGDIPTTTFGDAADCFKKAATIAPHRPMHHIELGSAYHGMGKNSEAKKAINHGLSLPETEKDDPATKAHARQMLKKIDK